MSSRLFSPLERQKGFSRELVHHTECYITALTLRSFEMMEKAVKRLVYFTVVLNVSFCTLSCGYMIVNILLIVNPISKHMNVCYKFKTAFRRIVYNANASHEISLNIHVFSAPCIFSVYIWSIVVSFQ